MAKSVLSMLLCKHLSLVKQLLAYHYYNLRLQKQRLFQYFNTATHIPNCKISLTSTGAGETSYGKFTWPEGIQISFIVHPVILTETYRAYMAE